MHTNRLNHGRMSKYFPHKNNPDDTTKFTINHNAANLKIIDQRIKQLLTARRN